MTSKQFEQYFIRFMRLFVPWHFFFRWSLFYMFDHVACIKTKLHVRISQTLLAYSIEMEK